VGEGFLPFLAPEAVAVIGASNEPTKRGFRAVQTLLKDGFAGSIYPINPRGSEVQGLRAYPDLAAVPGPIDLALVCTAAPTVPDIIEQCGRKGVAGAVVLALGFGESGTEGRALEARMLAAARRGNVRIVGPNTSGIFNTHCGLNFVGFADLRRGGIAIVSQSGNVALALVTEGQLNGHVGFSTYIGVGNESDLRFHDYLAHLGADANTAAIAMYVEGLKEPLPFLETAAEVTRAKPVVLCKGGRTSTGQQAARSHTGSLAGDYAVAKAALRGAGIVVVERSDAILPVVECLSLSPPMRSRRVAILADGGGHATIAADALGALGLQLPELASATRERLAAVLTPQAVTANPVDVANGADSAPEVIAECADIILADPGVDALLVVGMFGGFALRFSETLAGAEAAAGARFASLVGAHGKPIVMHSIFAPLKPEALERARAGGIPLQSSIEMAALALSALADYSDWRRRPPRASAAPRPVPERAQQIIERARAERRTALLEPEALDLLDIYGVATPPRALVRNEEETLAAVQHFGDVPLALKIVSPDILHKTEVGGVRLNVRGGHDAEAARLALRATVRRKKPDVDIRGVLATKMAAPGVELIVGVIRDPQFGPAMMFGLGGTLVESLREVVFRRLPLDRDDALELIAELRTQEVLDGARGAAVVDRTRLAALMASVSALCLAHPEIAELDLNPVVAGPESLAILDARIVLRETSAG
jgi:acyl-CoA synthetase (NDP forming)